VLCSAQTFEVLAKQESGLLAALSPGQRRSVRERLVSLVLATDFAQHKVILDEFQAMLDRHTILKPEAPTPRAAAAEPAPPVLLAELEGEDRLVCLKVIIKTADLAYLSKSHDYVQVWTDRVLEEFFAQARRRPPRAQALTPASRLPSRG
jgi:hypothetical protein